MFWCFGLDVLVIAVLWSQFEDCYVYFACLVAKKMQEEKQKYWFFNYFLATSYLRKNMNNYEEVRKNINRFGEEYEQ